MDVELTDLLNNSTGKTQQELELIAEEQQELAAEMTAQQKAQEEKPDTGHLIYTDYQSIFDMVPGREGEEELAPLHIKRLSPLAWVGTGTGVFVLELMSLGYVRVARNAGEYCVRAPRMSR